MSPLPPLGDDSDEIPIYGLDSDEGQVFGLDSDESAIVPGIDTDTTSRNPQDSSEFGFKRDQSGGSDEEMLAGMEDSIEASAPLPNLNAPPQAPPLAKRPSRPPTRPAPSPKPTSGRPAPQAPPPAPRPPAPPNEPPTLDAPSWGGGDEEKRLYQTMEIEPSAIAEWDAWDDYLVSFESAGDTPIISMISGLGRIDSLGSHSGEIFLPGRTPAPPRGRRRAATVDVPAPRPSISAMGPVPVLAGPTQLTPVERLVGIWRGDVLWILLSVGVALIGPALIVAGWDFYGKSPALRQGHPWEGQLDPGNGMGLAFGITGALLFLCNLTYILRRRFFFLAKVISIRLWLNLHFVFGLAGGSMILVHSTLKGGNWISWVSSATIGVAIASGIFGRYVLSHIPRREEGNSANLAELAIYLAQLRGDLRRSLGRFPGLRKLALQALAASAPKDDGLAGFAVIPSLIMGDLHNLFTRGRVEAKLRRSLLKEAGNHPAAKELIDETIEMVRLHAKLGRRLSQYDAVQDLMDTWRGLHMILALVLTVTMFLHVIFVLWIGKFSLWGAH